MTRRPSCATPTDTLFPDTTLFRSPWEDSARIASSFTTVRKTIGNHHDRPAAPAGSDPEWHSVSHIARRAAQAPRPDYVGRSEEHTSELQSLMRISYAVFCLTKKKEI